MLCALKKSFMLPSKAGGQSTLWKNLAFLCTLLKIYIQNSLDFFFTLKRRKKACVGKKGNFTESYFALK